MDAHALGIVETLTAAGHEAYVVGGGIRDLLIGARPKDFDVATSAEPGEVRKCFRRARLIGRRFPIVHVLVGRDFVEVTTFRALESEERLMHESGRILRDSSYGTLAEDALRRDFTVNALYYDLGGQRVLDFTDGLDDIRDRLIRLIGDPATRYREDPVRMLRALRFAAKLGFTLDHATEAPLRELAPLLADIPPARLFEEFNKLFLTGKALQSYRLLARYGLFAQLFPLADEVLAAQPGEKLCTLRGSGACEYRRARRRFRTGHSGVSARGLPVAARRPLRGLVAARGHGRSDRYSARGFGGAR